MLKSTLRVRFQGLGADVDENAERGRERRKERRLRRQRRKMAEQEDFQRARAFLEWLVQRHIVDDDDQFTAMLALPSGQFLINLAREKEYCLGTDNDEHIVQALLANDCDSWKNDQEFVLILGAWAAAATAAGYYLTYSYSSGSSEGGDRVEMDATRIKLVRSLGYYSDTFLASTDVLAEIFRLVASDNIDATTTALAKDLLGDNFQTVGPQDAGGVEEVQAAIIEAIRNRAPTGSHRDQLEEAAMWLVDANVTPEQRRLVFNAVFGPGAGDHVSRASTSVGAAPASSM